MLARPPGMRARVLPWHGARWLAQLGSHGLADGGGVGAGRGVRAPAVLEVRVGWRPRHGERSGQARDAGTARGCGASGPGHAAGLGARASPASGLQQALPCGEQPVSGKGLGYRPGARPRFSTSQAGVRGCISSGPNVSICKMGITLPTCGLRGVAQGSHRLTAHPLGCLVTSNGKQRWLPGPVGSLRGAPGALQSQAWTRRKPRPLGQIPHLPSLISEGPPNPRVS